MFLATNVVTLLSSAWRMTDGTWSLTSGCAPSKTEHFLRINDYSNNSLWNGLLKNGFVVNVAHDFLLNLRCPCDLILLFSVPIVRVIDIVWIHGWILFTEIVAFSQKYYHTSHIPRRTVFAHVLFNSAFRS